AASAREHGERERRRAEAEAKQRAAAEAGRAQEAARRRAEEEALRRAEEARTQADQVVAESDAAVVALPPPREEPDDETVVALRPRIEPDDATVVVAPPPLETAPSAAAPAVEQPAIPSPRPIPAQSVLPYAAAAALLLAVGLGYLALRSRPETRPPIQGPPPTVGPAPTTQPTTPPPAILPKLAWAATSTPEPAPSVNEGERLRLEAPVVEADALTDLTERWLLDDKEVGTGTSWEYVPGFEDGGQTRTVRVVASSQGSEIERSWRVTVVDVNRPPAIASVTPPEGKVAL